MASFIRQRCLGAILFLLVVSTMGSISGTSLRSKYLSNRNETSRIEIIGTSATTPPAFPKHTQDFARAERDGNGTFHVNDLLTPFPRSVSLLVQLLSLSMQNLDTRNESSVAQYAHDLRTNLLRISLKLNNAFLVSTINTDKMRTHSLFVLGKATEATEYLEKYKNSSNMFEFLVLPLKNLKETTDQTFNLSSQIASQFGDLFQFVDEVLTSNLKKDLEIKKVTAELQLADHEKKRMEDEINSIENEINSLKRLKRLDEKAFNYALDDFKLLKESEADKSQCYWAFNWRTLIFDNWYCPFKPDFSKIQYANQTATTAQANLEKTTKSLTAKEEEAAKKRNKDNDLLIRIETLSHEMHKLNKDAQLFEKISGPFNQLWINLRKLDESWKEFATICGTIQSWTAKSFSEIIEEANRSPIYSLGQNQLSKNILLYLNKTKQDWSLVKTVIDIYLEGFSKHIMAIVQNVEQVMASKDIPVGELKRKERAY